MVDRIWLGQNKKPLLRQHFSWCHNGWGDWRPPTLPPIQRLDPCCCIYVPTPCPVPLRGGIAPTVISPLSFYSLFAISWQTYFEALFSFHAEHPLAHQIPCDSQHSSLWYPLGVLTSLCTEAKQRPDKKRTWTTNGLKYSAVETTWGLPRLTVSY